MEKIILIILCIFYINADAQTTAFVSIKNTKKEAIPYVHVFSSTHEIGFLSNEAGECKVIIPNSDSMVISAIGYDTKIIYIHSGKYNIELKEISYNLDTIAISSPKDGKEEKIGIEKRSSKKVGLCSSNTVGYIAMLNLNHNSELARLKEVKFYVLKKERKAVRKVRLRIFSCTDKTPVKEILKQSIIIEVKKKGWNTIDLSQYNIYVPSSFFVGIEFIENEYYSDFCLGLTDRYSEQNETWVKRVGSYWIQLNFLKTEEKQLNLMINAVLETYQ